MNLLNRIIDYISNTSINLSKDGIRFSSKTDNIDMDFNYKKKEIIIPAYKIEDHLWILKEGDIDIEEYKEDNRRSRKDRTI